MRYNRKLRNKVGSVLAFAMGLIFSGLGVVVMSIREKRQSDKGGFAIEADDLYRYSIVSGAGAFVNSIILIILLI